MEMLYERRKEVKPVWGYPFGNENLPLWIAWARVMGSHVVIYQDGHASVIWTRRRVMIGLACGFAAMAMLGLLLVLPENVIWWICRLSFSLWCSLLLFFGVNCLGFPWR